MFSAKESLIPEMALGGYEERIFSLSDERIGKGPRGRGNWQEVRCATNAIPQFSFTQRKRIVGVCGCGLDRFSRIPLML
jgi:hypothetical protein